MPIRTLILFFASSQTPGEYSTRSDRKDLCVQVNENAATRCTDGTTYDTRRVEIFTRRNRVVRAVRCASKSVSEIALEKIIRSIENDRNRLLIPRANVPTFFLTFSSRVTNNSIRYTFQWTLKTLNCKHRKTFTTPRRFARTC